MKIMDTGWSKNSIRKWPERPDELLDALYHSFLLARRGKIRTDDENKIEMHLMSNLKTLRDDILERRYHPSRGAAFIVFDPVVREIFAASFRDRIVHHFLFAINGYWWDKRLIHDSYSCRPGKGVDFGVRRVQGFFEKGKPWR